MVNVDIEKNNCTFYGSVSSDAISINHLINHVAFTPISTAINNI